MISGNRYTSATDTRGAIADHYNALDPFYCKVWGEHVHHGLWVTGKEDKEEAVGALCRLICKRIEIKSGEKICDVGCGYGALARLLAREFNALVTGLTVSERQWEYAQRLGAGDDRQTFVLGDWLENGLANDSFDKVVAVESSEHMYDKEKCFTEMHRVLRNGGAFAVTAWLSRENPGRAEERFLLRPICVEGRLPSLGSASEYQKLIAQAGFRATFFQDLTEQVSRTWTVCIRHLAAKMVADKELVKKLFARDFKNRIFALTVLRLWLAYRTGSMRYGIFWGSK
jgi:cyclopropane fatty-acyl-phospholipid synthase-like methyltransferase